MDHSHARFVRFLPEGLVNGADQPRGRDVEALRGPLQCHVVMALEDRMWRDRRELFVPDVPSLDSAVERLRRSVRHFVSRMQLGPVADEAAGRDPENRF